MRAMEAVPAPGRVIPGPLQRVRLLWLIGVWCAVTLTPPFRLPNGIPIRVEDLLVFGAGAFMLFVAVYRGRVHRLTATGCILATMSLYIVLVTVVGPPMSSLSIGLKEFADAVRPLKFLIILLAVSRLPYRPARRVFIGALPIVTYVLLALSLVQFVWLTPESGGPMARLFVGFSELQEWHIRSFFGNRPFGTFTTPTDLGYYATLVFAVALTMKDMPQRHSVMIACVATLLLSNTRTFVYAVPFLLLLYAWASRVGLRRKLVGLATGFLWVALGAVLLLGVFPLLSTRYDAMSVKTFNNIIAGEFEQDQSIAQRVSNLYLVEIALERAPWTGIVSRDLSPDAFDSEYIMVLHRYGIIGMALTLIFYFVVTWQAWRSRPLLPDIAWLVLWAAVLTCLYGVTQGALINTRMGSLLFVILGLWVAGLRRVRRTTQERATSVRLLPRLWVGAARNV